MVVVKLFTTLREAAGKNEIRLDNVHTIRELIDTLRTHLGDTFNQALFTPKGEVKPIFTLVLNGLTIAITPNLERKLSPSDVVAFLPPVGGG